MITSPSRLAALVLSFLSLADSRSLEAGNILDLEFGSGGALASDFSYITLADSYLTLLTWKVDPVARALSNRNATDCTLWKDFPTQTLAESGDSITVKIALLSRDVDQSGALVVGLFEREQPAVENAFSSIDPVSGAGSLGYIYWQWTVGTEAFIGASKVSDDPSNFPGFAASREDGVTTSGLSSLAADASNSESLDFIPIEIKLTMTADGLVMSASQGGQALDPVTFPNVRKVDLNSLLIRSQHAFPAYTLVSSISLESNVTK